jgi:hypothetical protein
MQQDDGRGPRPGDAGATRASPHHAVNRPLAQAFGIGALVGMVLLGLIWVTVSSVSEEPSSAGRGARASITDQSHTTTERIPGPTPVQRCARVAGALLEPMHAAGPALDQWQVHVGAMNKLVVGAITLPQATAFWAQTRKGAKARIRAFHRADRVPRRLDVTCPMSRPPGGRSPALRACVRQVRADSHAVAAARTAVHTWEMHVGDMERLRSGKLSPAAATRMWLSMWQEGVRELQAYRVADRRARLHDNCYVPVG